MYRMLHTLAIVAIAAIAVIIAGCSSTGSSMIGGSSAPQTPLQEQAALIERARGVLQQQMSQDATQRIPARLVAEARCIAVFPSIIQGGLIVGGSRGQGIVSCRQQQSGFVDAPPAVYTLTNASLGLQLGGQQISVILLFTSPQSVDMLIEPRITFGSEIAAVAGTASFDQPVEQAPAPVVAYVMSRTGLFAGINLTGNKLAFDPVANLSLYGTRQMPGGVLRGQVQAPSAASAFLQTLQRFASGGNRGYSQRSGY